MKKAFLLFFVCFTIHSCESNLSESSGSNAVLSGSYANMLTINNHLLLINDRELVSYSLENESKPEEVFREPLGFGVESMFLQGDILFIGSRTTLYIYKISEAGIPAQLSTTEYLNFRNMCNNDPVVANETTAYVTLSARTTTDCARIGVNELRLYDINEISNPTLVNILDMEEPKGLGLDGEWLFVCEANNGIKVINVSDPLDLEVKYHFEGYRAFDVIPNNGHLLVVGPDSLYQYNYSDIENMHLLSAFDL